MVALIRLLLSQVSQCYYIVVYVHTHTHTNLKFAHTFRLQKPNVKLPSPEPVIPQDTTKTRDTKKPAPPRPSYSILDAKRNVSFFNTYNIIKYHTYTAPNWK